MKPISLLILLLLAPVAGAHNGIHDAGMLANFMHPVLGWDHLLAMLAVGVAALAAFSRK